MIGAEKVVTCRGSHRAMGLAQGEALQREVHDVFKAFLDGPEMALTRPRWLPKVVFERVARFQARRKLEVPLTGAVPEQAERMIGVARGAKIGLDVLYLGLAAELLLNEVHYLPGACSAIAVTGSRSETGEAMIAKNFDYPEPFRTGFCVRRNEPDDGLASIDVSVAPLAGCHSGVNEAGLAVTYNYGYGQDPATAPVPITLLVQRILERCRTVAEAERFTRDAPRAGGAILTVADASGDLAGFEVSPTRFGVRRGEELLAQANHYLTPEAAAVDVPRDAVYGPDSLPWLVGLEVHASSEARLGHVVRLGAARERFGVPELEAVLRDHGLDDRGTDDTLCRHGEYYRSTCAVVLLPAQRKLRVLFDRPCEQVFVEHTVRAPAEQRSLPMAG